MSTPTNPNAQSSPKRSIRPLSPRARALFETRVLLEGHRPPTPDYQNVPWLQKTEKPAPNTATDLGNLLMQSAPEGTLQPPSPMTASILAEAGYKAHREETQASMAQKSHEKEMRYKCDPIKAACGCELKPCNIALGGPPSILPFLPAPHFRTMMRNAIYQHPFKHKSHFENIHKMLGIDPTSEKTAEEVRKVAHIPWLLNNPYSPLPNRLELLIRRAIQNDTELTDDDRRHCYRMLGMDEHSIAQRDRLKDCETCPTCGTPKGYRLDGCEWKLLARWRPRPARTQEAYHGPYQYRQTGVRKHRPSVQAAAATNSSSQRPTGSVGPIVASVEVPNDLSWEDGRSGPGDLR